MPEVADAWVTAISGVCNFVSVSVSVSVRALKEKRLELSTPNSVHVHIMVVTRHALTPGGQEIKGRGYTVTKTVTVARLPVKCAAVAVCCCCRRGTARRMTA